MKLQAETFQFVCDTIVGLNWHSTGRTPRWNQRHEHLRASSVT